MNFIIGSRKSALVSWFQNFKGCALLFLIVTIAQFISRSSIAATKTYSLSEALALAHNQNLSIAISRSKLEKAAALEDQASAASYPKLLGTGTAAPVYKVTGDTTQSQNDIHTWGPWLQASVTLLQPIYTWGRLSHFREAAKRNSAVQKADIDSDLNQLDFEIKEIYYGAILTEQLFSFLDDGRKDLLEVQKKLDEDQQSKRPRIPRRDVYRFRVFSAEAEFRWNEAQKLRDLARHALAFKLGLDPEEEVQPRESTLTAISSDPETEPELTRLMSQSRPEFIMLDQGIQAKHALLSAEKANKMPMIFVGGMLTFAYSNVRTPQSSSFAFDPYNRSSGGIGIGFQWNFDFKTTLANEGAISAEITELERKQNYARVGFRMELKKCLADIKEARARYEASKTAFDVGRRWLVSESMNYSLGLTEIKDLIDAYLARAKTAKDFWEAAFRVNMAWASLTKTVGIELTPGLKSKTN